MLFQSCKSIAYTLRLTIQYYKTLDKIELPGLGIMDIVNVLLWQ